MNSSEKRLKSYAFFQKTRENLEVLEIGDFSQELQRKFAGILQDTESFQCEIIQKNRENELKKFNAACLKQETQGLSR